MKKRAADHSAGSPRKQQKREGQGATPEEEEDLVDVDWEEQTPADLLCEAVLGALSHFPADAAVHLATSPSSLASSSASSTSSAQQFLAENESSLREIIAGLFRATTVVGEADVAVAFLPDAASATDADSHLAGLPRSLRRRFLDPARDDV